MHNSYQLQEWRNRFNFFSKQFYDYFAKKAYLGQMKTERCFMNRFKNLKAKRIMLICALSILTTHAVFSQVDNRFLADPISFNSSDSGHAGFSFLNRNYMRNTEYFNKIESGRTLFGIQLLPALYYQVNKHIKIQGGLFIRKDFGGNNPFTEVVPTFTLKLESAKKWDVLFGTLEGTLNHRMLEPMFDIASNIEKHIENGFQLKHESDKLFFDTWINWEKFIERGSNFKEQLSAGLNFQPRLFLSENGYSVTPVAQGMISHRGGQIDKDTISFFVIANYSGGICFMKQNKTGFIMEIKLEPYLLFYHQADGNIFPFDGGSAVYVNASAKAKNLSLMLSYWNGNQFATSKGSPIYSSVSLDYPGHVEPNRQLIFVRVFYEKTIYEQLYLSLRFEPLYDLNNSLFDYSYSFYLSYRGDWHL